MKREWCKRCTHPRPILQQLWTISRVEFTHAVSFATRRKESLTPVAPKEIHRTWNSGFMPFDISVETKPRVTMPFIVWRMTRQTLSFHLTKVFFIQLTKLPFRVVALGSPEYYSLLFHPKTEFSSRIRSWFICLFLICSCHLNPNCVNS